MKKKKYVLMKRYYDRNDCLTYSYVKKAIVKPGMYRLELVDRLSEATIFNDTSPIIHYGGMVSFPIEV